MLRRSIFLCLLIFGSVAISASWAQGNSELLNQITAKLALDSNFIKLITLGHKQALNLKNNVHGKTDWSLVNAAKERNEVKTKEDMVNLLEKAGMKEVNTFLNLIDEYTLYMGKIRGSYPELKAMSDSDRRAVMDATRKRISIPSANHN